MTYYKKLNTILPFNNFIDNKYLDPNPNDTFLTTVVLTPTEEYLNTFQGLSADNRISAFRSTSRLS